MPIPSPLSVRIKLSNDVPVYASARTIHFNAHDISVAIYLSSANIMNSTIPNRYIRSICPNTTKVLFRKTDRINQQVSYRVGAHAIMVPKDGAITNGHTG